MKGGDRWLNEPKEAYKCTEGQLQFEVLHTQQTNLKNTSHLAMQDKHLTN